LDQSFPREEKILIGRDLNRYVAIGARYLTRRVHGGFGFGDLMRRDSLFFISVM